jgi:bacillithiol system protein YtxJ
MTKPGSAEAGARFTSVTDAAELDELFALSEHQPVILFKHSTTCPISAAAYQQMSDYDGEVSLIIVQSARDISRKVEAMTGIRHESPQAIILSRGKAVWSASHWKIKTSAIESAVAAQR